VRGFVDFQRLTKEREFITSYNDGHTKLTHLDLCTGIGGFHLAAEWAGFTTIGFSEIEPYCCRLLAEKWLAIPNYGDLRTADFSELRGNELRVYANNTDNQFK
jgi:site-specific DNA-cytosine methylase